MADATPAELAALAWMSEDKSRGYRAAGKEFDCDPARLRSLRHGSRAHVARARAKESPSPLAPPSVDLVAEYVDATASDVEPDSVEAWRGRVERARALVSMASEAGQFAMAKEWSIREEKAALELERRKKECAADEERKRAAEIRDPAELARKLLPSLPALARMAPDEALVVWTALGRALGQLEGDDADDYVPPDEQQRSRKGDREGYDPERGESDG